MIRTALAIMLVLVTTAALADVRVWVSGVPYLCDQNRYEVGCRKDWRTIRRLQHTTRLPEVRSWRYEETALDCRPIVSVVGTEHLTEANAKDAAERAWRDQVRYLHGERYMALEKAHRLKSVCTRSSTGDSTAAKVLEKVPLLEAATILTRCQIEARPCSVVPEEVGK